MHSAVTVLPGMSAFWGATPLATCSKKTFQGRSEQGRSFEIYRAETVGGLPLCHILFLGYKEPAQRRGALAALKGRPILTVGEAPYFLGEGGIIRFEISDRVEMSVNLDQARASSLRIQTKMLEVAVEIVENGTTKRRR